MAVFYLHIHIQAMYSWDHLIKPNNRWLVIQHDKSFQLHMSCSPFHIMYLAGDYNRVRKSLFLCVDAFPGFFHDACMQAGNIVALQVGSRPVGENPLHCFVGWITGLLISRLQLIRQFSGFLLRCLINTPDHGGVGSRVQVVDESCKNHIRLDGKASLIPSKKAMPPEISRQ